MATNKFKACTVEGCTSGQVKDDLCWKHYKKKHGKPPYAISVKKARLTSVKGPEKKEKPLPVTILSELKHPRLGTNRHKPETKGKKIDNMAIPHEAPKSNGQVNVTIDFADYPAMHKRLAEMAKEEFRTVDGQLLYMLRNTLQSIEKGIEA